MPHLFLHGRAVDNFFDLIGSDENSLTFALGWCLRAAPPLIEAIADVLQVGSPEASKTSVMLQRFSESFGITDVEVREPGKVAWIFEAKVGFLPPSIDQLQMYAERLNSTEDIAAKPLLIVIAQSDRNDLLLRHKLPSTIDNVPIVALSWRQLLSCCERAHATASSQGKEALRQYQQFIKKVLFMRDQESNLVYVVSIGNDFWPHAGTTFRKVVTEYQRYFHPVGPSWPSSPPNYLGFRWDGQLQSIHHVDSYKIVDIMAGEFPEALDEEIGCSYFLYTLGPAMRPPRKVANGPRIVMANRVTAALDLLLTCETISEALEKTRLRRAGDM